MQRIMSTRCTLLSLLVAVAVPLVAVPQALGGRTWTDLSGRKISAEFVRREGDSVHLRRRDGKSLVVPISRLSNVDLKYLDSLPKSESNTTESNRSSSLFGGKKTTTSGSPLQTTVTRQTTVPGQPPVNPEDVAQGLRQIAEVNSRSPLLVTIDYQGKKYKFTSITTALRALENIAKIIKRQAIKARTSRGLPMGGNRTEVKRNR